MSANNNTEQVYDPLEHAKAIVRDGGECSWIRHGLGTCDKCFVNTLVEKRPRVCYTHNILAHAEKFIVMDRNRCKSIW